MNPWWSLTFVTQYYREIIIFLLLCHSVNLLLTQRHSSPGMTGRTLCQPQPSPIQRTKFVSEADKKVKTEPFAALLLG